MSIAISEFWSRLVLSGITDKSGCRGVAAAFSNEHSGAPPEDPIQLADYLVRTGFLTRYQADVLVGTEEHICAWAALLRPAINQ